MAAGCLYSNFEFLNVRILKAKNTTQIVV